MRQLAAGWPVRIPLERAIIFVTMLHPDIAGLGPSGVAVSLSNWAAPYDLIRSDAFRRPHVWVQRTGPLRRRFDDDAVAVGSPSAAARRGFHRLSRNTLHFTNGEIHVASPRGSRPASR
jgi:hypothetical protein